MQTPVITSGRGGHQADFPAELRASTARMSAPTTSTNVDSQLRAYRALAGRWSVAGEAERSRLTPILTTSPFAQRIQTTLNAFTRSAWAGADASPPGPQIQMLKAFDQLPDVDKQIVAAMQPDGAGVPTYGSARAFRTTLQVAAEQAQADAMHDRGVADRITLSAAARDQLAGAAPGPAAVDAATSAPPASPEVAKVHAAYTRASA